MSGRSGATTVLAGVMLATMLSGSVASVESVTEGAHVKLRINPLMVELELPEGSVRAGGPVVARLSVANHGTTTVAEVVVTLLVGEQQVRIRGGATRQLGDIEPGSTGRATWQLCAEEPAIYLVMVRMTAELDGVSFQVESGAKQLAVEPAPGRGPTRCPAW